MSSNNDLLLRFWYRFFHNIPRQDLAPCSSKYRYIIPNKCDPFFLAISGFLCWQKSSIPWAGRDFGLRDARSKDNHRHFHRWKKRRARRRKKTSVRFGACLLPRSRSAKKLFPPLFSYFAAKNLATNGFRNAINTKIGSRDSWERKKKTRTKGGGKRMGARIFLP